jgi:hypothetical protein
MSAHQPNQLRRLTYLSPFVQQNLLLFKLLSAQHKCLVVHDELHTVILLLVCQTDVQSWLFVLFSHRLDQQCQDLRQPLRVRADKRLTGHAVVTFVLKILQADDFLAKNLFRP